MAVRRPGPVWWVWYALGGTLPERYAEWVFRDATCSTWILRHVARALTQISPVCLVLLAPGPLWIRLASITLGVSVALFYSLCFVGEATEHRLIKHGYPPGIGRETRAMYREAHRVTKYGDQRRWWE